MLSFFFFLVCIQAYQVTSPLCYPCIKNHTKGPSLSIGYHIATLQIWYDIVSLAWTHPIPKNLSNYVSQVLCWYALIQVNTLQYGSICNSVHLSTGWYTLIRVGMPQVWGSTILILSWSWVSYRFPPDTIQYTPYQIVRQTIGQPLIWYQSLRFESFQCLPFALTYLWTFIEK